MVDIGSLNLQLTYINIYIYIDTHKMAQKLEKEMHFSKLLCLLSMLDFGGVFICIGACRSDLVHIFFSSLLYLMGSIHCEPVGRGRIPYIKNVYTSVTLGYLVIQELGSSKSISNKR